MSTSSSPDGTKPESSSSFQEALKDQDVRCDEHNRIHWNDSARSHPRNWGCVAKTYNVFCICALETFMTAISSAGASTAEAASSEYGISKTLSYFAFITLYLLGQTIGGICSAPISEVFGRRVIYIIGAVAFCVFSAITAAVPSVIAVYFGRFFQGVAAAIPATVAFGNIEDMYSAGDRIWIVFLYTITGMLGLALGPIFAVYTTNALGWRRVYYISTIVSFVLAVACLFLRESNPDQLLEDITAKLRKQTGIQELRPSQAKQNSFSPSVFIRTALFRPLKFLVSEPLVLFCAILSGTAFGLIYGLTEALTIVYTAPPFNFSTRAASLAFIGIAIGECLNVLPRFYDAHVYTKFRQTNRRILPESKITSFAISAPSLAVGLWIFAWTIPPRVTNVPWPVSMIGLIFIGFSLNDFSYVLFGYATDSYGQYAASAVGGISLARTLAAAVFPLFTTQMFEGLGSNVATTILASVATLFSIFTPFLFLNYGQMLRTISKVASNDEDVLPHENDHLTDNMANGEKKGDV